MEETTFVMMEHPEWPGHFQMMKFRGEQAWRLTSTGDWDEVTIENYETYINAVAFSDVPKWHVESFEDND